MDMAWTWVERWMDGWMAHCTRLAARRPGPCQGLGLDGLPANTSQGTIEGRGRRRDLAATWGRHGGDMVG